jgi:Flp pilus assembly protein TadB
MLRCFETGYGLLALAIAVALAGYLVVWHGAHVAALLPVAVILFCPLMHLLLHRHGSGNHAHGRKRTDDKHPDEPAPE